MTCSQCQGHNPRQLLFLRTFTRGTACSLPSMVTTIEECRRIWEEPNWVWLFLLIFLYQPCKHFYNHFTTSMEIIQHKCMLGGFPHRTCHFRNERECTHQDLEHAIPQFHAFRSIGHRLLPSRRHDWVLHRKKHIPSLQQGRGLYKWIFWPNS